MTMPIELRPRPASPLSGAPGTTANEAAVFASIRRAALPECGGHLHHAYPAGAGGWEAVNTTSLDSVDFYPLTAPACHSLKEKSHVPLTGPRLKVLRALGVDLPGLSRKSMQERPQPPGQHGARKLNGRKSEFGLQLMEKQKLRFNYGLSERQLRRAVLDAKKDRGATGDKLVELLERRLDNLVFRAGFAPTIPAARQLVHGHIR
jgi:hypothetical protein